MIKSGEWIALSPGDCGPKQSSIYSVKQNLQNHTPRISPRFINVQSSPMQNIKACRYEFCHAKAINQKQTGKQIYILVIFFLLKIHSRAVKCGEFCLDLGFLTFLASKCLSNISQRWLGRDGSGSTVFAFQSHGLSTSQTKISFLNFVFFRLCLAV